MSILVSVEEAEFSYLKQQTGATAGNLSVQIDKLNKAGYVEAVSYTHLDVYKRQAIVKVHGVFSSHRG